MADYAVQRCIEALRQHNMDARLLPDRQALFSLLQDELLKPGMTVSMGGTQTARELGVDDLLRRGPYTFLDREAPGTTPEQLQRIYRDVFSCDCFITGTNAITVDGELYNIDGNGNRVAAMIFGPRQVVVIAGTNKIVDDMAAAERRLRTVAAPKNAQRLGLHTPCAVTGHCVGGCHNAQRICSSYVKLAWQKAPGRIKVLLLPEELGF